MKYFVLFITILFCFACNNNSGNKKESNGFIATINDSLTISYKEIDEPINQNLYDVLVQIYHLRKSVLEKTIRDRLVEIEAGKRNITTDAYYKLVIYKTVNDLSVKEYMDSGANTYGIPKIRSHKMQLIKFDDPGGEEECYKAYKMHLFQKHTDSLMKLHKIDIHLKHPQSPNINLHQFNAHYRGNLECDVIFWEVSDLECYTCKEHKEIYNEVYEKYKSKVKFASINFAGSVSIAALAAEAAAKQDGYWEFKDSVMHYTDILEMDDFFRIAGSMKLDLYKFKVQTNLRMKEIEKRAKLNNKIDEFIIS